MVTCRSVISITMVINIKVIEGLNYNHPCSDLNEHEFDCYGLTFEDFQEIFINETYKIFDKYLYQRCSQQLKYQLENDMRYILTFLAEKAMKVSSYPLNYINIQAVNNDFGQTDIKFIYNQKILLHIMEIYEILKGTHNIFITPIRPEIMKTNLSLERI